MSKNIIRQQVTIYRTHECHNVSELKYVTLLTALRTLRTVCQTMWKFSLVQ